MRLEICVHKSVPLYHQRLRPNFGGVWSRSTWSKAKKHSKKQKVNRWSNGAFLRKGVKRGSMSMVKGFLDEGGRVESGQRRILKDSNFWPKKWALFLFQENQETLHEHSTLVGLTPNFHTRDWDNV